MNELKLGLNHDEILRSAYHILSNQLNEPIGLISQTIPKTPQPNHMNALQLQALVQEYDSDIKRFKDVLAHKTKPHTLTVEPPLDRQTLQKAKTTEQEHKEDTETIRQAITILKKRRRPYSHKLWQAKINQFKIKGIISQAEQINREAAQIITEIQEHQTKIKTALNRHQQLQSHFNDLHIKFNSINLDPTKTTALSLPQKLPTMVQRFCQTHAPEFL